jgi:hypothetical protein
LQQSWKRRIPYHWYCYRYRNGKTVILETQDPTTGAIAALDTVKVENGKFEIKGS